MLRVVDLFCGAGGISEGLRQAGLDIVYAVDKDRAAASTFAANHPEAVVERRDVAEMGADDLPPCDVIVGGPPCIEFSASKQGRGDILGGLKLVQAYLRLVYLKSPKYWIMENVPRLVLHLPERIPLRWIGVDGEGSLHVPVRGEFNIADFGVPQARRRFLMGNFPLPIPTHFNPVSEPLAGLLEDRARWVTVGDILSRLPSPLSSVRPPHVTDPLYGIALPTAQFTDHFHHVALTASEVRSIRRVKEAHPFMGWMPFPDPIDRPARTVVATQLGRETLVFGDASGGVEVFRRATVRECAILQSFPTTYQFLGGSLGTRYRLVGDAVPPMLSYLIGKKILEAESLPSARAPLARVTPLTISELPRNGEGATRQRRRVAGRKFAMLIPGKEVRGCRVELDNLPLGSSGRQSCRRPPARWRARLYVGEGKANLRHRVFRLNEALSEFVGFASERRGLELSLRFLNQLADEVRPPLPSAAALQEAWDNLGEAEGGPDELGERLGSVVDAVFPKDQWKDVRVVRSGRFELIPDKGLRVRLAAALVAASYACELVNGKIAKQPPRQDRKTGPRTSDSGGGVLGIPPEEPHLDSLFRLALRRRQGPKQLRLATKLRA